MERVLITGATGFVGRRLVPLLAGRGFEPVLAGRKPPDPASALDAGFVTVGEIGPASDWSGALDGCSAVIHLAARTPARGIPEHVYSTVNDRGTERLAKQAAAAGVRRFVYVSSLHALVDGAADAVVDDGSTPRPMSAYGRSKLAAEDHVERLQGAGMVAVSLRPPIVTGAEAAGSWRLMQKIAASGLPLPVGRLSVPRSVISVDNLVDAIVAVACANAGALSGRFLVADPQPIALRDLFLLLRLGMGKPPRIFDAPQSLLSIVLAAARMNLLRGTQVDASRFEETYAWKPALTTAQGVMKSGSEFLQMSLRQ